MINKMLFRDIKQYKFQMFAIILIIFVGITLFSACVMSYMNLRIFKEAFYTENNFLDAFIDAVGVNDDDVNELWEISGITAVEARIELDGLITLQDENNATAKVIAYRQEPYISQLRFFSGHYLDGSKDVLISKNFAEFNKFQIDDTIDIKILDSELELKIKGIVESPEFIITIKSRDYVMPSIEDYGIVYIEYDLLEEIFDFQINSYNQVYFKLDENADIDQVKKEIEDCLGDKFLRFTERYDQISEIMAREDI